MYLEKMKNLSRPMVAILTLCLVFTMAPLLPMNDSDVNAESPVPEFKIEIVDKNGSTKTIETWYLKNGIYRDKNGYPVSIIKDFADPIVYSSGDNKGARFAVVTEGILMDELYAYVGQRTGIVMDKNINIEALSDYPDDDTYTDISSYDDATRYYIPNMMYSGGATASGIKTVVPFVLATKSSSTKSYKTKFTEQDLATSISALVSAANNDEAFRNFQGVALNSEEVNGVEEANLSALAIKNIKGIKFIPDYKTVTLDGNKGKSPSAKVIRAIGEKYNLTNATRSNYSFKGWFTAKKGGTKIEPSTLVTNKNDHTLYAQWTGTNKNLKSLKASNGTLTKKFKSTKTKYSLKLKNNQSKTKISVKKAQNVAKVQIKVGKGKYKTKSSITVQVAKGKSKTVYIKVKAQDGKTKTYKVIVKRAK